MEGFPTNIGNKEENISEAEKIVELKLNYAKNRALEEDEMDMLLKRKSVLESENTPENILQLEKVNRILAEHAVVVNNLNDYKTLLKNTGISEDQVIEILAHENAHANKAESLDENFGGYALLVWRDNDIFKYLPFAMTSVGGDFDNKRFEKEMAIARAPDEYGEETSLADKERIKSLEQSLINDIR